jgi:hypothetical protein
VPALDLDCVIPRWRSHAAAPAERTLPGAGPKALLMDEPFGAMPLLIPSKI